MILPDLNRAVLRGNPIEINAIASNAAPSDVRESIAALSAAIGLEVTRRVRDDDDRETIMLVGAMGHAIITASLRESEASSDDDLSFGGDAGSERQCHEREAAPGRDLPELIEAILSGSADQIKACCSDARSEDIRASLDMLEEAVGFRAGFLQGNPSIFKIGVTAGMGLAELYLEQRAAAEASSDD